MAVSLQKAGSADGSESVVGAKVAVDPRLKPAAHEFEASLMKELLEPLLHDPLFAGPGDRENPEGGGNALLSFGAQALAQAISDRGGFGIAEKILANLEPKGKGNPDRMRSF